MSDKDTNKEAKALTDEIKNAPKPEDIAAAPIKVEETKKEEKKEEEFAPIAAPAAAAAAPVVDKAAADKIAAEQKAVKKAQKEQARKQAKIEKKAKKAAELQAKIEQCPKDYRPVSTGQFFWLGILCLLPAIGFIFTILLSIGPRNKNLKNFARAIFAGYIILIIVALIFSLIATLVMGQSFADLLWPFVQFFDELGKAVGL